MHTDISLSQFLAIQEKGVSAWEFEPELEIANCFVEGRTEIEFFDSECSVQTNLPVPKQNDVYYWEAKIYDKPDSTLLSIGMSTKPYPLFRLPGMNILFFFFYSCRSNDSRLPQNVSRLSIDWPPEIQPTFQSSGIRSRVHSRRCYRSGIPAAVRDSFLHAEREEAG